MGDDQRKFSGSVCSEPEFPGECVNSADVRTLTSTIFRVDASSLVRRSPTDPEEHGVLFCACKIYIVSDSRMLRVFLAHRM